MTRTMYELRQIFLPTTMAALIGYQAFTILPLAQGALVDYGGFTLGNVGVVTSVELLSMAVAASLVSLVLTRLHRARVAFVASVIAAIAQFVSVAVDSVALFLLVRGVSGLACGVVAAILVANFALAREPERLTALVIIVMSSVAVLVNLLVPLALLRWQLGGAYWTMGALSFFCAPFLLWLPATAPPQARNAVSVSYGVVIAVVVFSLLFNAAGVMLWSFVERMGVAAGMSVADVGRTLALATCAGICGAGLAAVIGKRFGSLLPLLCAGAVTFLAGLSLPFIAGAVGFALVFCVMVFADSTLDPFVVGAVAMCDASGRVMTIYAAVSIFGSAIGPYLGSWLLADSGDFTRIGIVYFGAAVLALSLLLGFILPRSNLQSAD